MTTLEDAIFLAKEIGFDLAQPLDMATIKLREDIRVMCNAEQCKQTFGTNWSCPPAGPTLEEIDQKIKSFDQGIIVQLIGELEDEFDFETTAETSAKTSDLLVELSDALMSGNIPNFAIGPGACTRCKPCTFPDAPCPYPDDKIISMSACGIFVSQLCKANDIPYYYGKTSIAFIGCIFF